jgi:hypothetical protein
VRITSGDTSPEAAAIQLEAWRRLGPEARVALAARLSDEIRQVSLAGIRQRNPDYDDDHAMRALLRLIVGDDLARAVCPGRPLVDP